MKLRRVYRRLRLIDVELHGQFRIARLQRRVHQVAGEHGVILAAAEGEGDMARRCARRRQDARCDRRSGSRCGRSRPVSPRRPGSTLSPNGGTGVFAWLLGPVVELGLVEHVARLRKVGTQRPLSEPRVPADMVDMQMRAHDIVDVADGNPAAANARA
jgi:hypothetical protein